MSQYVYTVINKENRELTGTINAPDEQTARQELNTLGFSIISLTPQTTTPTPTSNENSEEVSDKTVKFDFAATDKNQKKIVGTIQGDKIFNVYKRLIFEYQFEVQSLYPSDLSQAEKEKAQIKGIDALKDQLLEEQMATELLQKKQQLDEKEFQDKQAKLKVQVDFVLQKVGELLNTYQEEIDPSRKAKIKYFVEKILRIKNSTNLDYIKQTCEEMLTYIQKEEIFLNQEQRLKEKTLLSIDAKSMMMQLNRINHPGGRDLFDYLRTWRQEHITDNPAPTVIEKSLNSLISLLIGSIKESPEILQAREKLKATNAQLMEFLHLYFQAPDPNFKKETKETLIRLWHQRKVDKADLARIIQQRKKDQLTNLDHTKLEILEQEIFSLAGYVLTFYIIYYFVTIYLNSKQIDFIPDTKLNLIFQTSIIKYFFTTLFFFVCLLGIKIEFFKRKHFATPVFLLIFLLSSSLIILNF